MEGQREGLKEEFIRLAVATGWSQIEIARRLDYTPSTINGIITGGANPSKALLRTFLAIIAEEKPELVGKESPYPEIHDRGLGEMSDAALDAAKRLDSIRETDPARFAALNLLIGETPPARTAKPAANSSRKSRAEIAATVLAEKVRGSGPR